MNSRFNIQILCFILLFGFSQVPHVSALQSDIKRESTDPYFKSPKRDQLPRIVNQNPKSQAWVPNTGNPKQTGAQNAHKTMPKVYDVEGQRILPKEIPDFSKKVVNKRLNQNKVSRPLKSVGAQATGNLSAQTANTRTPVRLPDYLTIEPPAKPAIAQPKVELQDDPDWKKRLAEIPWAKSPLNPDYKPDFSTAGATNRSQENGSRAVEKMPSVASRTPLVPNNIPLTPNRPARLQAPAFPSPNVSSNVSSAAATSPSLNMEDQKTPVPREPSVPFATPTKPVPAVVQTELSNTDNDFEPNPSPVQNPYFKNQITTPAKVEDERLVVSMPPEDGIPVTRIKHPEGLTNNNDFSLDASSPSALPKIRSLDSAPPTGFAKVTNQSPFHSSHNQQFTTNQVQSNGENGFQKINNEKVASPALSPIPSSDSDFQPTSQPTPSDTVVINQSSKPSKRSIINTHALDGGFGSSGERFNTSSTDLAPQQPQIKQTIQTRKPVVPAQDSEASKDEFEPGRVLALVGGEPIFVGDIMFEVNQMIERFAAGAPEEIKQQQRPLLIKRLLPKFIDSKILFVATVRDLPEQANLDDILEQASSQFDEQVMSKMMEQMGVETSAEFDAHLRLMGSSLRKLRRSWSEEQFVRFFLSQQLQVDTEVTHQEMLDYYKKNSADYEVEARARWEQVMVRKDKYPTADAAKTALAQLGNKIVYGAKLEAVARDNSHGFMARNGGQHDWTTKNALVLKEVDNAIFSLEVGQLSDIIESRDGFHIIRVHEREEAGRRSFLEAQVEIKKTLADDKREAAFQQHLHKLKERIPVEIYEFTGKDSLTGKTYTIQK